MSLISNNNELIDFLNGNETVGYITNNIEISQNINTNNGNKKLLNNTGNIVNLTRLRVPETGIIGGEVEKDMRIRSYDDELDPYQYQNTFFSTFADFIDENIVAGDKDESDRLNACQWRDLGDDIFDDWGFFFIYDVSSQKYYFPLLNPRNSDVGVLTTQTFNAFDRIFTIVHGWAVQGIFKMKITVNDNLPFRFGAYGNMGSDGDEEVEDLTQSYTKNNQNLTLYYRRDAESGDDIEILYSYIIPIKISENNAKPYDVNYDGTDMALTTSAFTKGMYIYFAKTNDVKNWVINDISALQ